MFVNNLIVALVLTVVLEVLIAILFNYRKKSEISIIVLINIITNPLLNYLLAVNNYFNWLSVNIFILILLEIIVVMIEWLLLRYAIRKNPKKLFLLSLVMNATSFIVGLLLFRL